ncbi:ATP-binding protein [Nocardiopsis sp. CT-R113]|uniref:ATP-binding protein n=1 Tax=Nocardiopsis codii TaxID=3065942 RepID=A0ABU7KBW7_9ACTN|nr:ATP-binding protein [Nocardiopsis sp. CT-R113]MEE2039733.1 ATP-binding protein [Nocardiopsis sp. CT-R113]
MTNITSVAKVVSVSPDAINIEIYATQDYEDLPEQLEIGSYVKIHDDSGSTLIAIVQSYRVKDDLHMGGEYGEATPRFIVETQPVGHMDEGKFRRGGKKIAIPPQHIEIASAEVLSEIYASVEPEKRFSFGSLAQNNGVRAVLDGDKFFAKHIGVVGSTGSGKSCTVARILQSGSESSPDQKHRGVLNNSHIIIFDLHGEYASAFPDASVISSSNLHLPCWMMNSEELEEMFIESNEHNSHNQVSQFRNAVISNKVKHAQDGSGSKITYDSPSYFSMREVVNYLDNLNREVISKLPGEDLPKLADDTLVSDRSQVYFSKWHAFVDASQKVDRRASNGPFFGEFSRFLMRINSKMSDRRLSFLLSPKKDDGGEYLTHDMASILGQFMGYGKKKSNVTILDLSGIPFEVLSVVVSLISRLVFNFSFHFRKVGRLAVRELPFLLVYEEAHNYVPQGSSAKYNSVKRAIERIAKEGRKYGVSLMIVSQRPSEISETVFSQCNNFVAMRLTNPIDQNYVKRLIPDSLSAITDSLPSLEQQEAIVIGDSVNLPTILKVDQVINRPDSQDINFHTEWKEDWLEVAMDDIVKRWQQW